MIEHESPVAAKEEGLVGTDTPKYDYGEGMKSTRDFTGKQSLKPQLFFVGQVVRKQVDEGTKNRPILNWKQFVVRHAKYNKATGKWTYQLDYEKDGVSNGPYSRQNYFAEPELKDPR